MPAQLICDISTWAIGANTLLDEMLRAGYADGLGNADADTKAFIINNDRK